MLLNTSGTRTYTGGTIAFGSNPGVVFAGTTAATTIISSAVTGSAGMINANSLSPSTAIFRADRHHID